MSKITEKNEIDAVADNDVFYARDTSAPSDPDKRVPFSKIRPAGNRITNNLRFVGNIAIPALAAGAEAEANVTVAGAAVDDHAILNIQPPANIAVLACWVSANNTVTVRLRNLHASSAYAGGFAAGAVLVSRSIA